MNRERVIGEIIPASAEQSKTKENDEMNNGARRAIDLHLFTPSYALSGSDGTVWLKISLDKTYCVQEVIWYWSTGDPYLKWACTENDCGNCEGDYCNDHTLTVSTEGAVSDPSALSGCKYGDTVKLKRKGGNELSLPELAVVGKQGNNCKVWVKFAHVQLSIYRMIIGARTTAQQRTNEASTNQSTNLSYQLNHTNHIIPTISYNCA